MKFDTYATFEVMHGRKSTVEELISALNRYSRESILYLCSAIGMILKLWQGAEDHTHYELLIRAVFEPLRGDWYCLSPQTRNRDIVFHRRQLLLIMKLAIEHCPANGYDIFNEKPGLFGTICLMASDQFHYSLLASSSTSKLIDRDKIMRVLTEFVPVLEYGSSRPESRIVRSHIMITNHANGLRDDPDFIDIAGAFENQVKISLEDYETMAFGLFSRCATVDLSALQKNERAAAVREENFHTTAVPRDITKRFLSELKISPRQAVERIHSRDFGANDFTVFRDKPLLVEDYGMLPVDVLFLLEKFAQGPYWTVNNISRDTGNKLRRFWGRVFESYVNEQLAEAARQSGALFISDPRRVDNASVQVCDALLLEGDALIMLEYKSSMFSAEAKYSGDHLGLLGQIEQKFVREFEGAKKRGSNNWRMPLSSFLETAERRS